MEQINTNQNLHSFIPALRSSLDSCLHLNYSVHLNPWPPPVTQTTCLKTCVHDVIYERPFDIQFQSRSMISLIPEERKREFRNFGLTPMAAPAAYKYFSRSDFYNSTAIYNRSMTSSGYNAPTAR